MSQQGQGLDRLAIGMAELTAVLLSPRTVEEASRDIAEIASRMLPGRPMAGVTLDRGGDAITVASTGAHARAIDEVQPIDGSSPGLHAIHTAEPVSVPDTRAERRWGEYSARMLAHGVRSIYSEPLLADGTAIGALDLYSPRHHGFDTVTQQAITLIGAHTGMLLSATIRLNRQAELTEQLHAALASRSVIDQALGMIMARRCCNRDTAFAILRDVSQHRNIKLAAVAAEVIRSITGTALAPPHFDPPRWPASPASGATHRGPFGEL